MTREDQYTQAERHHSGLRAHLEHISQAIAHLIQRIDAALPRHPEREITSITTTSPYTIRTRGYRHNRIWSSASITVTIQNSLGIITGYPLNIGWNPVDLDNETIISAPSATSQLIVELTDYDI